MSEIRMIPMKSTVRDKVLRQVAAVCGREASDQLLYDDWKYDEIMQNGSDELIEVVFLITGGIAPGGRRVDDKVS